MTKTFGALLIVCVSLSGCKEVARGEKVGTIIKLAQEGIFCKTWEAQLIRGGMAGGSGSFGVQPFHFTIEDRPDLVAKIQKAMDDQEEVKVFYRQELATFCRSESHDYFLTDVQPLRSKP